ncbi:hypothetical protein [Xylanibacter ruminicola]|uniref:DUF975 family protein n=1 Tax=Xylanibacter ruminicola TaxID=839 RepID=A0A1M6TZQ2_XYLRU|nr:hypothetical protein [Xylanibacter ruminicola]SHK62437.1 hypothetical protein SAMN05216463_107108 [Xylanibacter ruminicola]
METEKKEIEIKLRSSQACIREGYQLYTGNFRKIFRATWWLAIGFAILQAAASALPVLLSPTLLLPALALGVVAVIIWLFVANWRLKKRQFISPLRPLTFGSWMRHLGKVFIVTIVCITLVAILTLMTSLPTMILMAANWQSKIGMLNGDPAGMPSSVRWLSLGVFLVAGFIQAYVWLTTILPFYLMKGTMGIQDKEKEEFNKKTI